jgi:hypothetical protein
MADEPEVLVEEEPSGLLTLDEEDPTVRGNILRAGPVAHEGRTEPSVPRPPTSGPRDERHRAIALELIARLAR